jgi:hypothetical protein
MAEPHREAAPFADVSLYKFVADHSRNGRDANR